MRALAALAAVLLVAAACGGAADGGSAAGEPDTGTETPIGEPDSQQGDTASEAGEPEEPGEHEAQAGSAPSAGETAGSAGAPETAQPASSTGPPESADPAESTSAPSPDPAAPPSDPSAESSPDPPDPPAPPAPPAPADQPAPPPSPPGSAGDADSAPELPEPSGGASGAPGNLEFSDCGRAFRCGTLTVPLDHDDPGGATVELAVGMIPAGDPSQRIGYLLVNPGGPGSGIDGFLDFDAGLAPELLQRFDVIGWDPRGAGASVPSGCWAEARDLHLVDPVPDSPAEQAELDAAAEALAEACLANLGEAVDHIGTIDTVRDMDAIRRALGAEQINYLGFSYGTLLGTHYADMFGEHLRAAVLDGVLDPSLPGLELAVGQIVGFARTIDAMFAWCPTDPSCAVTGDPEAAYEGLMAQLEVEPLRDAAGRVVLDPARAVLAAVMASYAADFWPFFFQGLAAAIDGDGDLFGRLGEAYMGVTDLGAFSSIGCTDGGAATSEELADLSAALAEVAGDFGRASAVSALPCVHWPVKTGTMPVGAVAAPDAPPVLVLGNRGDNATPYEWAVSLADQLDSGVLVSYDGNEHTSYGRSDCVDRVVHGYLIDLAVPPGNVDCPAEPR